MGTGDTFVPTNAEVGFPLRVVAVFTDNFGVLESVTGTATGPVANTNQPAAGAPALSSLAPQAGNALTVDTTGITDPDGVVGVTFSFQFLADGVPIPGATNPSFTPGAAQVGKVISVVVSFTDNHGTAENRTSAASAPVIPAPVPVASISPVSISFAPRPAGTQSVAQPVTVTNTGTGTLVVSSATIAGANPNQFTISNGCSTLGAGASCTIDVQFTPTTAGAKTANINIVHNAAGSPTSVGLSGTATVSAPALSLSTASIPFGNGVINTVSGNTPVTVTNTGTANLVVSNVARAGTNPGQFQHTNGCTTVAPGGSCTINVRFAPTTTGAKSATLNITSNAPGSPHSVALTGTGINGAPALSLSTAAIPFGNRAINTVSPNSPVTVTNTGTANLVVSAVNRTGTNANQFQHTNNCGTVAPGASCTINVRFAPTTNGAKTATLNITSNAPGSPHTVALTGTGVTLPTVTIPAALNFGNRNINTNTNRNFQVTNNGPGNLVLSALPTSSSPRYTVARGTCPVNLTLAAGNSCNLVITFRPITANLTVNATLTVTSNASNSPTTAALTGRGV